MKSWGIRRTVLLFELICVHSSHMRQATVASKLRQEHKKSRKCMLVDTGQNTSHGTPSHLKAAKGGVKTSLERRHQLHAAVLGDLHRRVSYKRSQEPRDRSIDRRQTTARASETTVIRLPWCFPPTRQLESPGLHLWLSCQACFENPKHELACIHRADDN